MSSIDDLATAVAAMNTAIDGGEWDTARDKAIKCQAILTGLPDSPEIRWRAANIRDLLASIATRRQDGNTQNRIKLSRRSYQPPTDTGCT
jgi:hypothetical protein